MDRPESRASRAFSYLILAGGCSALVVGALNTSKLDLSAVVIFTLLIAIADRSEVELPGGENVSASTMLVLASVVVFRAESAPVGPMIVSAIFGALYLRHWRERQWSKLAFNVGMGVLYAGGATLVAFAFPATWLNRPGQLATIGVLAALAALTINLSLLAIVDYLADGRKPSDLIADVRPMLPQVLPFAVLGAFIGSLYLNVGSIIVPLLIAPILVARQVFATSLQLKETEDSAVRTLIKALEAKDRYTAGHVERVATYAVYIGEELSLGPSRVERLRLAALMHDIGKLIVPNHLLNKPGKLTADEYAEVRRHEDISIELLESIDFLAPVAPSASSVFTDYKPTDPRHPIEPYIVHVADAYDAMTSTRSYRKALPQEVAFAELREKGGTQFHPIVVEALIAALDTRDEVHGADHETTHEQWAVPPPVVGTGSAGLGDLEATKKANP